MTDNKKPREFWIELKNMAAWDEPQAAHRSTIHVIEYSAYDALLLENKELEAKYNFMVSSAQQNAKERDILEQKNEELRFEIEKFKAGVNNFKCFHCGDYSSPFVQVNLMSEVEELRKSLKLAVEALKKIEDPSDTNCMMTLASKALDKIKEKNGEGLDEG